MIRVFTSVTKNWIAALDDGVCWNGTGKELEGNPVATSVEVVVPVTKTSPFVSMAMALATSVPLPERYVEYLSVAVVGEGALISLTNTWEVPALPASGTD